jgi:hypothetical protein
MCGGLRRNGKAPQALQLPRPQFIGAFHFFVFNEAIHRQILLA